MIKGGQLSLRDRVRLGEPFGFEGFLRRLRAFVFRTEAVLRFAALLGLALRAATLRATALPLRLPALFSLPLRALVLRTAALVLRSACGRLLSSPCLRFRGCEQFSFLSWPPQFSLGGKQL